MLQSGFIHGIKRMPLRLAHRSATNRRATLAGASSRCAR